MSEPKDRRAAGRHRILKAGLRLVRDGGFRELQISNVAAAAGIATGTVYLYFPSKSELCAEVFRFASRHEIAVLQEIADSDGSAGERLRGAVRAFVRRALEGARLAYALIAEPVDPAVEAERIEARIAYRGIFARILAEGVAAGEFAPQDLEIGAACLVGLLTESMVVPLAPEGGQPRDPDDLAVAIADFAMRAVGATAAAPLRRIA